MLFNGSTIIHLVILVDVPENLLAPEALDNPDKIGNISKPYPINCMPSCETLDFPTQTSYSAFPQRENFFYQKVFCITASHIFQATCKPEIFFPLRKGGNEYRKEFLRIR